LIKENKGNTTKLALAGKALDILEPKRETPSEPEEDEPMPIRSFETFQGRGPRHPRGDGDDPFTLADLDNEKEKGSKHQRLEGNPPKAFDGDRAQTIRFLTQFKRFMLMNQKPTSPKTQLPSAAISWPCLKAPKLKGGANNSMHGSTR